ncbi:unnamed protein product [Blepharisma stoltei]|uniref:Uncharacterized protein n=1 Tax=Blepharisma stoltei TaxID=1481888 RepID=A0AAU9JTT7_9CILI|nr:unnamed protein product [Blepharisma stoltei]
MIQGPESSRIILKLGEDSGLYLFSSENPISQYIILSTRNTSPNTLRMRTCISTGAGKFVSDGQVILFANWLYPI